LFNVNNSSHFPLIAFIPLFITSSLKNLLYINGILNILSSSFNLIPNVLLKYLFPIFLIPSLIISANILELSMEMCYVRWNLRRPLQLQFWLLRSFFLPLFLFPNKKYRFLFLFSYKRYRCIFRYF